MSLVGLEMNRNLSTWGRFLGAWVGVLPLISCATTVIQETTCSDRLSINFGEIRVAGQYEFRATALGGDPVVCKMTLSQTERRVCGDFVWFNSQLLWGPKDSERAMTIQLFRDGVLVGERTMPPRCARPRYESSGCEYVAFDFATGKLVSSF